MGAGGDDPFHARARLDVSAIDEITQGRADRRIACTQWLLAPRRPLIQHLRDFGRVQVSVRRGQGREDLILELPLQGLGV
jgi:hypothetical protein